MNPIAKSIRPFIGAADFDSSRRFYTSIGFKETVISYNMSLLTMDDFGFYLQDAYVKDWIDNTMVFLEVQHLDEYLTQLESLDLATLFKGVKISKIVENDWGKEFFLHDPSRVLWHIGSFTNRPS
ncbi:glyoxalase [Dokdonia sp. PRO95]|uniref:glyoxalase n=1 Tax=Dokdonia sp. PRO95 TaxID=1239415 RepID=UPI000555815F|nr:glyoxalase [Dokdonia sp. PRO95]